MGIECLYVPYAKIDGFLAEYGHTFDYIFISRIYQVREFDALLKRYCPQAGYIFNTVDLHFVREKLEADLLNDPELQKQAAETQKYELAMAAAADAVIVISSEEKKLLEEDYHLENVIHIPQARKTWGTVSETARKGAAFVGSAHPPNLDALRYFYDEILPLLPEDFELTVVGEALRNIMEKSSRYRDILKCPRIKFVGFVADLGDVFNFVKLTVAPLRYGAGTKGKVASSMAYGVPCVSSVFGTEGTGMQHGTHVLIARNAEEFARLIRQLENDDALWQKISAGGVAFIREFYAPEKIEKKMDVLFENVKKRRIKGQSCWAQVPTTSGVKM